MQLLHSEGLRKTRVVATFGHRPFGVAVVLCFVLGGSLFFGALVWMQAGALPWWGWLIAAPFLAFGALVEYVIVAGMLNAVIACFRAGNWVAKVADHGLYLKLRSYQNEHFDGDAPTVVFVAYSELRSAGKVVEEVERKDGEGGRYPVRHAWLELCTHGSDTAQVAEAVARERLREGPARGFLGISTRSRAHHVPVFVAEPGVLRVEWRGKRLLDALPAHVERLSERVVRFGEQRSSGRATREEVAALARRGDRMSAVELLRESEGIGLTEAVRLVDELVRAA